MFTSRFVAVLTVITVPLLLAGHIVGRAAPTDDVDRKVKESFEALQKKLPALVADCVKKQFDNEIELKQVKCAIKLARLTGASDAKVILAITMTAEEIPFDIPLHFSFHLHYFDGLWTTTRADASTTKESDGLVVPLMLAIDQAGEK